MFEKGFNKGWVHGESNPGGNPNLGLTYCEDDEVCSKFFVKGFMIGFRFATSHQSPQL